MEELIQNENKIFKSFKQGINLFGTIFLDVIVVFIVAYFFDVENFFTNGGFRYLKSSALTIYFGIILTLWTTLLWVNYIKAKKEGLFNVSFHLNKSLYFCIPLAIILPLIFSYLLEENIHLTVIDQYNFFLNSPSGNVFIANINTSLQYLYWLVEMLIVIFIIDSFHNLSNYIKFFKFIPWGGIGLAFTWGLEQLLMRPNTFLHIFIMSIIAGILYKLSKRNFFVVLIYFVILILIKG
ncbi:MAG: hypothetical protein K0Q49_997 [Haloplasmataceae bacterium]|jgi:hypothetical protein|nr:hypothetical protein [Haloplasmataceae bacterium]